MKERKRNATGIWGGGTARIEYADFIQISMFHPPHYHTSVVPFKNYVPHPPTLVPSISPRDAPVETDSSLSLLS